MAEVQGVRPVESARAASGRKIIIATLGSLGDLHPYVAIAKVLHERGENPVLATSEVHRERIERQGLAFHPMRPDMRDLENDREILRKAMDLKTGTRFVVREIFMRHLRDTFADLRDAVRGADLLVTHGSVYAGPLVAELTGVPWVSGVLSPLMFMSKYDPGVPPQSAWVRHLHPLGPRFFGPFLALGRRALRHWGDPVRALRRELGLPPGGDPFFEGAHSPLGVLVLYSKALSAPHPGWPAQAVQTGFAFFDDAFAEGMPPELARFLDAGSAPIVFTLGSSAVNDAGRFYEESLAAARRLDRRAVLLVGNDPRNRPTEPLSDDVIAIEYAPYSELFSRAAATVHQGGVGTTGQALRSGRPTLVVPWSHDQPDNAERVRRAGVGLTIARRRYSADTATAALRRLLEDPAYAAKAAEVGRVVQGEGGAAAACDVIANTLAGSRNS